MSGLKCGAQDLQWYAKFYQIKFNSRREAQMHVKVTGMKAGQSFLMLGFTVMNDVVFTLEKRSLSTRNLC